MESSPNDPYQKQKKTHGAHAGQWWILASLGLHFYYLGWRSILSLKSAGFFIIGMFLSAVILGIINYGLQKWVSKIIFNLTRKKSRKSKVQIASSMKPVLYIVQTAIVITSAWLAFNEIYF